MLKIKSLFINFISLSAINASNIILPLAILPYLIKTLGGEVFGMVAIGQAVAILAGTVVDFGFSVAAPRDVAIAIKNKNRISKIYSSIFLIRFLISLLVAIFYFLGVYFIVDNPDFRFILYISFIGVLSNVISPIWLMQGMGLMKEFACISIPVKILLTLILFLMVNDDGDFFIVPFINGMILLMPVLLADFFFVRRQLGISFVSLNRLFIYKYFKDGRMFFLSRIASVSYSNINIIFSGYLLGASAATIYMAAEKILIALSGLFDPLVQTIYPFFCRNFTKKRFLVFFYTAVFFSISVSAVILIWMKEFISLFFLGRIDYSFLNVLSVLIFALPISVAYVLIGTPLLVANGYKYEFNKSIIQGFFVHVLILSLLWIFKMFDIIDFDLLIGFSLSILFSKFIVLFIRGFYVKKFNLL